MLLSTDVLGSTFSPSSESVLRGLLHTFLSTLATEGAHWSVLAAVGSWVGAEAPRQGPIG